MRWRLGYAEQLLPKPVRISIPWDRLANSYHNVRRLAWSLGRIVIHLSTCSLDRVLEAQKPFWRCNTRLDYNPNPAILKTWACMPRNKLPSDKILDGWESSGNYDNLLVIAGSQLVNQPAPLRKKGLRPFFLIYRSVVWNSFFLKIA